MVSSGWVPTTSLTTSPPATTRACQLTSRELSVVELVALGHTNRLIARRLSISCHTVDQHLRSAFEKAGAASRAELIALLYVMGVFDPAVWPPARHLPQSGVSGGRPSSTLPTVS